MDTQINRTIFDITAAEEEQLMEIAQSDTKTGYKAQSVLYAAKGTEFPVTLPELPGGGGEWQTAFKNATEKVSALYPNPAQNGASFKHRLNPDENGSLQIFSITGIVMGTYSFKGEGIHQIDISHLQTGLYFCNFKVNGETVRMSRQYIFK